MARIRLWQMVAGLMGFLAVVVAALSLVPQLLYPPLTDTQVSAVSSAEARIQLQQAQSQLQNDVRSTLLQAVAGLLVVAGTVATWRQVQVNRDGQITERFTRAVEQLGNTENVDVRIGGIYALERVAANSPIDRNGVQFMLAAFVRNHAPWLDGQAPQAAVDQTLPWLQVRAPEIQAAVGVLGRRPASPEGRRLYLSRVDLRSAQLDGARLTCTQLRYANLARSWLRGTRLDGSDLKATDLRQANLERAGLVDVKLNLACLAGANLRGADLTGADLRGADLEGAILKGIQTDLDTQWPADFDLKRLSKKAAYPSPAATDLVPGSRLPDLPATES